MASRVHRATGFDCEGAGISSLPLKRGGMGWGSRPPPDRQPKSVFADFGGYSWGQVGNIRLSRVDLPLFRGRGSEPAAKASGSQALIIFCANFALLFAARHTA